MGDVNWQVRVAAAERADTTPTIEALKQAVRRRMQDEGWHLAVALTDLPLRANRRPVTAHASAMYRVGLLSVPALGARSVPRRAMQAVLNLVEGLLGEEVGRGSDAGETGRARRMRRRLDELRSPLGRARAEEDGTIAFVGATLRGNLRLLVGMVRANQPARVIARLSRALAVSLGTAAYAMTSSSIWMLSHGMAWPRLALLGAASIITLCVVLVLAHGLWERASGQDDREAVVLFNLATSATLGLAVLTLYASLLVLSVVAGAALIPPSVYHGNVGHAPALADYLKLGWLAATIATLAGALGSLIESDESVREAAYRGGDLDGADGGSLARAERGAVRSAQARPDDRTHGSDADPRAAGVFGVRAQWASAEPARGFAGKRRSMGEARGAVGPIAVLAVQSGHVAPCLPAALRCVRW